MRKYLAVMIACLLLLGGAPTQARVAPRSAPAAVSVEHESAAPPEPLVALSEADSADVPFSGRGVPLNEVGSKANPPALSAEQADAENVEFVGHIGGATEAVAVQGNYAYIAVGPRLTILDISSPASPTMVGKTASLQESMPTPTPTPMPTPTSTPTPPPASPPVVGKTSLMPDVVRDIAVDGDYAYVADGNGGLQVVDVSDPARPTGVGYYDTPGYAWGVAVSEGYAYVADGEDGGMQIVDVSTPANPTRVGACDTPGSAWSVTIAGDHAYVADGDDGGLRVIEISTPSRPTEVGFYDTPVRAVAVAVAGNYAYVADGWGGLWVMDVSTPANPMEVGTCGEGRWYFAADVAVVGDYVYVAALSSGLRVVDVSIPSDPTEVGFYDTPVRAVAVAVAGNYAYVADSWNGGLRVVDVSTPFSPIEINSHDAPGLLRDLIVAEDYAYLAAEWDGMGIVDVSNPTSPAVVGSCDTSDYAWGVSVAGSHAYIADYYGGLRVVDVSNPAKPTEVGFCGISGRSYDVAIAGHYAYVANSEGLRVIDISTPSNPTEIGFCETPDYALGVTISESYAYIAAENAGLQVVNVSNPTNPTKMGFYDTPGSAVDVAVAGDYAYVADGWEGGLRVVNISTPASPVEVGFYNTPGEASGVTVVRNYAYIADDEDGLRVADVSTPSNPTEVGFYDTPGYAYGVAVAGDHAYVAGDEGGLFILRYIGTEAIRYDGPLYLPDDSVVVQEKDGQITMGDHVHLQLPFLNTGTAPITSKAITLTAASAQPAVSIYDGSDWGVQATVPLTPTVIGSGEVGVADFWLYVDNPDPDDCHSLFGQAKIHMATADGEWDIHLHIAPVSFTTTGDDLLTSASCLHHPDNYRIQNYAQYAAGGQKGESPGNNFDPDTPSQAVRNLVHCVKDEFEYQEGVWEQRVADVLLLTRRSGDIGVCRDYADLTTGLLRSLGLPTRYVVATLLKRGGESVGHAWTEGYVSDDGWRQADSTWDTAFDEQVYEASGYTVKQVWADRYPLSSASKWLGRQYRCIPPCYQEPVDCVQCIWKSNQRRLSLFPDLSCVEDVTSGYHDVSSSAAGLRGSAAGDSLGVQIDAPRLVTRTRFFTVDAALVNSTTQTLDVITATVSRYDQVSSTIPLYDLSPSYHTVSDLASGETVTVTWAITPLVTGSALPLRVGALGGEVFGMDERPLAVNEPGTPLPLALNGCGPGEVQPNRPFTLTAYALGERLQVLTDTLTTVTATLYATPTLNYSATYALSPSADGFFRRAATLPSEVPIGAYQVDFAAVRPDYDPAETATAFFVAPTLTTTLDVTPPTLRQAQPLTLTAQVYERGTPVDGASVWAELDTSGGVVTVPLTYSGGVYTTTLRPVDLVSNLGDNVEGGQWRIAVKAHYYGSTAETTEMITVLRHVYLPLVLRNR